MAWSRSTLDISIMPEEMTLEFCAKLVGIPFSMDDYKIVMIEFYNNKISHTLDLIDLAHREFEVIKGNKDKLLFRHMSNLEKILDDLEVIEKSRNHTHAEMDAIMWRIWTVRDIIKQFMKKYRAKVRTKIRKDRAEEIASKTQSP